MKILVEGFKMVLKDVGSNSKKLDKLVNIILEDIKPIVESMEEKLNSTLDNTKVDIFKGVGASQEEILGAIKRLNISDDVVMKDVEPKPSLLSKLT